MPDIEHEIKIVGTPDQVRDALTTVDGLRCWQTSHTTGDGSVGGRWDFAYPGHPRFVWEVEVSEPNRIVWRLVEGPGDSVGTTASFELSATDDDRTLVEFAHSGWPGTDGSFRKCNTLWGVLLHHLATTVRTGEPAPAFD